MARCKVCNRKLRRPVNYCPFCGRKQSNDRQGSKGKKTFWQKLKNVITFKGQLTAMKFMGVSLLLVLAVVVSGFLCLMAFGQIGMKKSDEIIYLLLAGIIGFLASFSTLCFIYCYGRYLVRQANKD